MPVGRRDAKLTIRKWEMGGGGEAQNCCLVPDVGRLLWGDSKPWLKGAQLLNPQQMMELLWFWTHYYCVELL